MFITYLVDLTSITRLHVAPFDESGAVSRQISDALGVCEILRKSQRGTYWKSFSLVVLSD